MKAPMEVPPTMSMGIPDSSIALITPMWEQPLAGGEKMKKRMDNNGTPPHPGGAHPALEQHPPGSAPPQDQGDGVAGEDPRQPGEVAVPVGALLKDLLIHLPLRIGWPRGDEDGGGGPPRSPREGEGTHTYQFGGATAGEDAPRTLDVEVTRAPTAHVEPLNGAGRAGTVLAV